MISQWCSTPSYTFTDVGDTPAQDEEFEVPGHKVCLMQRWHNADHKDCCWGAAEKESWACTCTCHAEEENVAA